MSKNVLAEVEGEGRKKGKTSWRCPRMFWRVVNGGSERSPSASKTAIRSGAGREIVLEERNE